jgi:flagellar biosynthesis protein FliQ
MDHQTILVTSHEALRALVTVCLPLFAVTLIAFGVAALQTVIAVREESVQYSVRLLAGVSILALFGTSFYSAICQVMETALQ